MATKKKASAVSELEQAKAYAQWAKVMHRQLIKVGSQMGSLEETLAIIRGRKDRTAVNNRIGAYSRAGLKENLLSRRAGEFDSVLEVVAIEMEAAIRFAHTAIEGYISTWNETLDAAQAAKKQPSKTRRSVK